MSTIKVDDIQDSAGVYTKQQVVQVVNTIDNAVATGTTQMPSDDTIPQSTEGTEFITLAITPKATTNILKIEVNVVLSLAGGGVLGYALFQDSTADALAANTISQSAGAIDEVTLIHYMVAGTVSATTFKFRAGRNAADTLTFNGKTATRRMGTATSSSITITEYQPS